MVSINQVAFDFFIERKKYILLLIITGNLMSTIKQMAK